MKIHLASEQQTALKMLHKCSRDLRVCDRIRCVLLADEGWSAAMIAKSPLIDAPTVRRHLNDWLSEQKLAPENGGSQSHFSEEQTQKLRGHLASHLLPTTQSIIELVDEGQGIRYTIPGMNKWLHRKCTASRQDEWPDFLPQQHIMAVAGIVSTISRRLPDFPVSLVYQAR